MYPVLSGRFACAARLLYRWIKRLIVAAIFIQFCIYANDVHTRWTKNDTCDWSPVKGRFLEPDPSPPYVVRYCYVGNDQIWLQLYDASGRTLLAERMYYDTEKGSFFWSTKPNDGGVESLMYTATYSDSNYREVAIPPTIIDRFLAALP
jgi:hypothetical protein